MQNYFYFMYFVIALIFGKLAWMVFKDIKDAGSGNRQNKLFMYLGIFIACLLVYAGLRIFAAEPLSDLYFKLGGTVR